MKLEISMISKKIKFTFIVSYIFIAGLCLAQSNCHPLYRKKIKLKINGQAYFEIAMPNGKLAYTKKGRFRVGCFGVIALFGKYDIHPFVTVPFDTRSLKIDRDGMVSVRTSGASKPIQMGLITANYFTNPEGLKISNKGFLLESDESGSVIQSYFGDDSEFSSTLDRQLIKFNN